MRLILTVAAIVAGVYTLDVFLAAQERSEIRGDAERLFTAGERQLHAGQPREAIRSISRAHALERGNRLYETELASAQLNAGDADAARATLEDVLQEDSNDARANLLMARVMVAKDRYADADSYYHRAIYGSWPASSRNDRDNARLELARMLAQRHEDAKLLSEVLLLQNDTAAEPARERTVAALFLEAGAASRAEDVYRRLIHGNASVTAEDYAGLARSEMLLGNYGAARNAWREALRTDPENDGYPSQLDRVEQLASLDPTPRRLSTADKFHRSEAILNMVKNELESCAPGAAAPAPAPPAKSAKPVVMTNELSEAMLENAERLWRTRSTTCKQPPEPFDVLPVLMKKLTQ